MRNRALACSPAKPFARVTSFIIPFDNLGATAYYEATDAEHLRPNRLQVFCFLGLDPDGSYGALPQTPPDAEHLRAYLT